MTTDEKTIIPVMPEGFKEQGKEPKPSLTSFLIDEETLDQKELEKTQWLFPLLMPSPALIGLVGRPGSYKTFFAHWMARRLSQGLSLFESYTIPPDWSTYGYGKEIRSLIIEEEMGEEIVQERIRSLKSHKQENIFWMLNSGFQVTDEERVKELVKIIEDNQIKLLILDPFITISGLKDENDNAEASRVMKILLDSFVNSGPRITVLFIHHPSKSSDGDVMRGAGDILGKSYMGFALEKIGETNEIKVKCVKSRWNWPKAFKMGMVKDGEQLKFVYLGKEDQTTTSKKSEIQDQIVALLKQKDELTKVQISALLARGTDPKMDKTLSAALTEMKQSGLLHLNDQNYKYSLI